ncbi:hypothetical protein I316_07974 [Kwoniella heveanensis BCC8398]|uniref:Tetraspanin n=1 Tax=Kwoniella heveanensis BCC8398 TaxID=1296120 RepID=A0A1B9GHC2_9TREE|nr:hypothetical protein I316_07974 [Kwoniella heveanensis BCC8398]
MKKLLIVWSFLDFCLLAAGVLCIVTSIILTQPNQLIIGLMKDHFDFKMIGISLGSTFIAGTVLSIPAIISSYEKMALLKALNWYLVMLASLTLAISEFEQIWHRTPEATQQAIQNKFSCCGYFNGTLSGGLITQAGFCTDSEMAASQPGCQTIITSASSPGSDYTLSNIFTTIFGFEAIIAALFLATVCVINERNIAVRFKRIDEKRGGGGFV